MTEGGDGSVVLVASWGWHPQGEVEVAVGVAVPREEEEEGIHQWCPIPALPPCAHRVPMTMTTSRWSEKQRETRSLSLRLSLFSFWLSLSQTRCNGLIRTGSRV